MLFENLCAKDGTSWLVEKAVLLYQIKLQNKNYENLSIDIDDDHIFPKTAASESSQVKQRSATGEKDSWRRYCQSGDRNEKVLGS